MEISCLYEEPSAVPLVYDVKREFFKAVRIRVKLISQAVAEVGIMTTLGFRGYVPVKGVLQAVMPQPPSKHITQ